MRRRDFQGGDASGSPGPEVRCRAGVQHRPAAADDVVEAHGVALLVDHPGLWDQPADGAVAGFGDETVAVAGIGDPAVVPQPGE